VSAVLTAQEPSAKYLDNLQPPLLRHFDLIAQAPSGVARLRELILTLAVQGKLVPQDPSDEPASELLKKIRAEKDRLIAEGKIKRDKPLAEITDEEKPFELPDEWEWVRLGQVQNFTNGFAFKSGDFSETGVGVVRIGNVHGGEITESGMVYLPLEAANQIDDQFFINPNDLVITMTGDVKLGFNNSGNRYLLNQRVGKISPHLVEPKFLVFCLNLVADKKIEEASGSVIPNVSTGEINSTLFALPPLAEQSRIVTRVDELMQVCDALEASGQLEAQQHAQLVNTLLGTLTQSETPEALADNWQRIATHFDVLLDRPEAVDALEQTILQLAVRGLLVPQDSTDEPASVLLQKIRTEKDHLIAQGKIKRDKPLPPITDEEQLFELPQGWEWARINDLVEMLNGYAFKSEWFKPTGTRLLRNLNISHGHVDWSQPACIDSSFATEFSQFALSVGDVVLSLDRPIISTGLKYAVINETDLPCLLLQRVARLAPNQKAMSLDFLELWLHSDLFVGTIDPGRSNGVPHISTKQVGALFVGLPPLTEQSRIVTRVNVLRTLCADLRQRLADGRAKQAKLTDVLTN
jgi:type I restriction enzyme S subunit